MNNALRSTLAAARYWANANRLRSYDYDMKWERGYVQGMLNVAAIFCDTRDIVAYRTVSNELNFLMHEYQRHA